jgi:hypothetical protein
MYDFHSAITSALLPVVRIERCSPVSSFSGQGCPVFRRTASSVPLSFLFFPILSVALAKGFAPRKNGSGCSPRQDIGLIRSDVIYLQVVWRKLLRKQSQRFAAPGGRTP